MKIKTLQEIMEYHYNNLLPFVSKRMNIDLQYLKKMVLIHDIGKE